LKELLRALPGGRSVGGDPSFRIRSWR